MSQQNEYNVSNIYASIKKLTSLFFCENALHLEAHHWQMSFNSPLFVRESLNVSRSFIFSKRFASFPKRIGVSLIGRGTINSPNYTYCFFYKLTIIK